MERLSYSGYAIPALAFALGWVVFCLRVAPFLYQTTWILVGALCMHFIAEAMGPLRSALMTVPQKLEEAARTLGEGPWNSFRKITLPLLKKGLLTSVILVFLSTVKELPISVILAPLGYSSLSLEVWSALEEAMYRQAAPYALLIMVSSAFVIWILLRQERGWRA